jgi:two-component system CheB/CheR fusion protein
MNAMSLPARVRRWCGVDDSSHDRHTFRAHDPVAQELDRLAILAAELQHRLSNTFAVVQALAQHSARNCESLDDFLTAFENRIAALARVQSAMIRATDDAVIRLHHLINGELVALAVEDEIAKRVSIQGPRSLSLLPRAGEFIALAVHELAVNSCKYGALSADAGDIRIGWQWLDADEARVVRLEWRETGMPIRAKAKRQKGFGSELILRALPRQLGTQSNYTVDADGVHCAIDIPAELVVEDSRL